MIAITISNRRYCLLSFPPHDQLLSSDLAVYPIGRISLNSSRSFFNSLCPCSEEPIYSYCRHSRYCWFSLATSCGICPFPLLPVPTVYILFRLPKRIILHCPHIPFFRLAGRQFYFSVPSSVVTEPISIFRPYIGRIAENNLPAPIFSSAIRSLSRLK